MVFRCFGIDQIDGSFRYAKYGNIYQIAEMIVFGSLFRAKGNSKSLGSQTEACFNLIALGKHIVLNIPFIQFIQDKPLHIEVAVCQNKFCPRKIIKYK